MTNSENRYRVCGATWRYCAPRHSCPLPPGFDRDVAGRPVERDAGKQMQGQQTIAHQFGLRRIDQHAVVIAQASIADLERLHEYVTHDPLSGD